MFSKLATETEAKSIKFTDAEGKKLLELVRDVKTESERVK